MKVLFLMITLTKLTLLSLYIALPIHLTYKQKKKRQSEIYLYLNGYYQISMYFCYHIDWLLYIKLQIKIIVQIPKFRNRMLIYNYTIIFLLHILYIN